MKDIEPAKKGKAAIDQLNINEDYAKRFQYNKKRQLLEKAKAKYGKDFPEREHYSSSSSSYASEDSEGELDNEIVRSKFIDTLLKLKDEKESKAIIANKAPIFNDQDFALKRPKEFKSQDDKVNFSITDALVNVKEEEEENDENDVYSVNYKPKAMKPSQEEKKAFIAKANEEVSGDYNADNCDRNFFDDGFLIRKPKTQSLLREDKHIDTNKEEHQSRLSFQEENEPEKAKEKVEGMTLAEALNKCKVKPKNVNMKLLKEIWGDQANLSKEDRFLRNYILSEGWIERDRSIMNKNLLMVDKIDDENEEKFDDFENKYNHRFEEENGANITTYQRNLDTYRQKDETRVKKRKEHERRKEEEKKRLKEEMKQAREAQAEELKEKLEKIEKIAGTEKIAQLANEFNDDRDFDMKKFDQKMNEIFNEDYYNQRDEEMVQKEDNELDEGDEGNEAREGNEDNAEENDDELWFFCDHCKKAIKENKIVYECKTCSDYSLCKECFKSKVHSHPMKKNKIPFGCKPPENYKEIIEKAEGEALGLLKCTSCNKEIITHYYFTCSEGDCSEVKICKTCRGVGKSIHEHKLAKFYHKKEDEAEQEEAQSELNPKEKLQAIIDSKSSMAIDDVIDKEIPSKFHYAKVSKDTNGISNEMLLFLDDKVLNQYIPLKKISSYSDFNLPDYKRKQMRKHFEKLLDKKKKEMLNDYNNQTTQAEKNEKYVLGHKRKHSKGEFISDKAEFQKKRRLETYGITE